MIKRLGLKNKPIIISNSFYRGKIFIDIRKNFIDEKGEYVPTRKGLQLTPDQWMEVIQVLSDSFLKSSNSVDTNFNWNLELSKKQQLDLIVEFNNGQTTVKISEEFNYRINNCSKERIIISCLNSISDVLVEIDEIELIDKVCKNIIKNI